MGLEEAVLGEAGLGTSGWGATHSSMAETPGKRKWVRACSLQRNLETLTLVPWSKYTWAKGH